MLDALEAVTMRALLPQHPEEALENAVLLRTVGRDKLLFQPVASDDVRKAMAGEYQAIVPTQQDSITLC
ncbi:hypothetical protein [Sagittula sp. NFXS13]|uniref:hypothetical protein n=1 Tax=Sagittula sp. NFXS13 TaxID=2819095 RepID=UPI0032DE8FEF